MAFNVSKTVRVILIAVIGIVITFQLIADTATDVSDAANNLTEDVNSTGQCVSGGSCPARVYPITNFFKKKGVLLLAFMAGVILLFIDILVPNKKGR